MTRAKPHSIDSTDIAEYLRQHPDFFANNPELLDSLKIPHNLPDNHGQDVSSLIEYQVRRLQKNLDTLKKEQQHTLQQENVENFFLHKIHDLSLELLEATSINELYKNLRIGMKLFYGADRTLLFIFRDQEHPTQYPDLKFIKENSKLQQMFTELFHRNKPLCDSLQEEYLKKLFAGEHEQIKSTAIIALDNKDWQGLLVLASHEPNRYTQGPELELLVYIKDVLQLMLDKLVK